MNADPIHLVIDANIFISAFLKSATTRHLVLDERLRLYAPEDLLRESRNVLEERFAKKLSATSDFHFHELFSTLASSIHILEKSLYKNQLGTALEIAPHRENALSGLCSSSEDSPVVS